MTDKKQQPHTSRVSGATRIIALPTRGSSPGDWIKRAGHWVRIDSSDPESQAATWGIWAHQCDQDVP
ncbi:MAG: hypothetical protein ACYDBJ_18025 [Aggregatilineales bacterium]